VTSLVLASGEAADIMALSIAEHLPWGAEHLRQALTRLPILR
jgi:hypothetical protein